MVMNTLKNNGRKVTKDMVNEDDMTYLDAAPAENDLNAILEGALTKARRMTSKEKELLNSQVAKLGSMLLSADLNSIPSDVWEKVSRLASIGIEAAASIRSQVQEKRQAQEKSGKIPEKSNTEQRAGQDRPTDRPAIEKKQEKQAQTQSKGMSPEALKRALQNRMVK